MEPIEISHPEANCSAPGISKKKLHLYQVSVNDSGEGLPYAPVDWPNPGDTWRWKVGRRVENGYFRDRYLYPPGHLPKIAGAKRHLASKVSLKQYVHLMFPGEDADALLNSFSWKIPSKELSYNSDCKEGPDLSGKSHTEDVCCKAGNKACCSLVKAGNTLPELMSCDICCSEHGFCVYCCCLLCCRTVDSAYNGYNHIRCEARVDGDFICGHVAHLDCALRAHVAGTLGGSIGLDAEFFCRRCDSRTNIVPHIAKHLEGCQTIDSRDDIEKILTLGIRLLHNSKKANAQWLLHHIQFLMAKLKRGCRLEDLWSKANISMGTPEGAYFIGINKLRSNTEVAPLITITRPGGPFRLEFNHQSESFVIEDEFDQIMLNLRQLQEYEYELAEERLIAQKNAIQSLYEQLGKARSDLSRNASPANTEVKFGATLGIVGQMEREIIKFKEMKEVGKGFGTTPKRILKDHFNYPF